MRAQRMSPESVQAFLADALPIRGARIDLVGLPDGWAVVPVLEVDCTDRPEVDDLPRVHQTEGEGNLRLEWMFLYGEDGQAAAVLTLQLESPVECQFKLVLNLKARDILASIVEAGGMALEMRGGLLYVSVPTHSLRDILSEGRTAA